MVPEISIKDQSASHSEQAIKCSTKQVRGRWGSEINQLGAAPEAGINADPTMQDSQALADPEIICKVIVIQMDGLGPPPKCLCHPLIECGVVG